MMWNGTLTPLATQDRRSIALFLLGKHGRAARGHGAVGPASRDTGAPCERL